MSLLSSSLSKTECQVSVLQDQNRNEKISMLQLPRTSSLALATDQCCLCEGLSRLSSNNKFHKVQVQFSAFVNAYNSTNVELYCEEKFVHSFQVLPKDNDREHDAVLNIKLIPMPSDCDIVIPEHDAFKINDEDSQMFGLLIIVGTLRQGLTMHSVLLRKKKSANMGTVTATTEVVRVQQIAATDYDGDNNLDGRRLQKMAAKFLCADNNTNPSCYHLCVATSSSKFLDDKNVSSSQRIDCFTYDLNCHNNTMIFPFSAETSSVSSCVLVNDVVRVKSLEFGESSNLGITSLSILTSTELILVEVPVLQNPLEEVSLPTSRLLLAGCHPTHQLGTAQAVISLGCQHQRETIEGGNNETIRESFAVICDARTNEVFSNSPTKSMTPSSDFGIDIMHTSLSEVRTSRSASYDLIRDSDESRDVLHALANVTPDNSDTIDLTGKIGLGNVNEEESVASSLEGMNLVESQDSPLIAKCLLSEDKYTRRKRASDDLIQSELYPDNLAHILLVSVECNGEVSPSSLGPSISSIVASFPPQLSSFDTLALCRIHENTKQYAQLTPSRPENVSGSELMFSPSPGSNMTHSNLSALSEESGPVTTDIGSLKFALVCTSKDSSDLHFMVLSANSSILRIESQETVNLHEKMAPKSSEEETTMIKERCTVKSISVQEQYKSSFDMELDGEGIQVRVIMSVEAPISEDNDPDEPGRLPINVSFRENSSVAILNLLQELSHGTNTREIERDNEDEAHIIRRKTSKGNNRTNNGCTEHFEQSKFETNVLQKLDCLMQTLETFESKMTRRMDAMEHLFSENSQRLTEIEEFVYIKSLKDNLTLSSALELD